MNRPVAGAIAPVPTPLDDAGRVDIAALEHHLEWLAAEGLDGALVLGTNGEFPSLTLSERVTVAEAAVGVESRLELLLGVGSCSLPESQQLAELAGELGYRAVLCPPPFYYRSASVDGIAAYLSGVFEASALPVLLYHIPQLTGVEISDTLIDTLLPHPALVGVKDSTGNETEMDRLVARFSEGSYLVGHDRLVTRCLRSGGAGSISAAANVAPSLVAAVHRDPSRQDDLDAVRELLDDYGLGPAVKALLGRQGLGVYAARPPGIPLPLDRRNELFAAWDRLVVTGRVTG